MFQTVHRSLGMVARCLAVIAVVSSVRELRAAPRSQQSAAWTALTLLKAENPDRRNEGSAGLTPVQLMGTTKGYDDHPDGSDVCLLGVACAPGAAPTCGGQCSYTFVPGATAECTGTTADPVGAGLLAVDGQRISDSLVHVTFTNRVRDQCETFVPGIDVDLVLEFRQVYDQASGVLGLLEFKASGTYDGYPWHELYLNGTLVFTHDPCITGDTPISMFPWPVGVQYDFEQENPTLGRNRGQSPIFDRGNG